MVSSTIPEMFVNSNTLHFSQTNVLQSHVCVKLLQMLTFKKYIKINAKPCKYVHLKLFNIYKLSDKIINKSTYDFN